MGKMSKMNNKNYNSAKSLEAEWSQWAHNFEIPLYNVVTTNGGLHNLGPSTPLQSIKIPVESADVFHVF